MPANCNNIKRPRRGLVFGSIVFGLVMLTGAAGLVVAETPGDRAAEPTRDRSSSDDLEELRKIAARTRASVTKVKGIVVQTIKNTSSSTSFTL